MKKWILFLFILLLGFVFTAAAENLGEVAKKEKARREELAKSGKKVTTFTNADVDNLKSTATYEFSGESPDSGETTSQGETGEQPPAQEIVTSGTETSGTSDVDIEIEELNRQKEQAEQEEEAARETIGQGGLFHTHNAGNQYQTAREAEKKAEEADQKAAETEAKKARQEQEPE